ncbi:hypothetical protein Q9R08_14460 [Microbacterium sp. QXD-8]|uniref:Nuclear transport factor 2 family protein n=1 Tax=Microbacterium psychrotolerans TaxID=3068321 RepID=A0ABU0Z3M4_9MICO|nr:hypothetical protein [Microbacterium sp. QXD-8]MDQ7879188.1 hypothetical protein [Microbacterium sp. QXD-8]
MLDDATAQTLQLVEVDGVVLHRCEYRVEGRRWRNTDALEVRDGRVTSAEVHFGGAVA